MPIYRKVEGLLWVECDQCHTHSANVTNGFQGQSARMLRAAGWYIEPDGHALCPSCADQIIDLVEDRPGYPGYCPPPHRTSAGDPGLN